MNKAPSIVIAIDGTSASGKGTIARRLAKHFGFVHLDTGLLYRSVGLSVLRAGDNPEDAVAAERAAVSLDPNQVMSHSRDPEMRVEATSKAASKVAAIPQVRAALLKFQRDFAENPPLPYEGAVLDGRDIGTVIAPNAPVKLYVTADTSVRALRRYNELQASGENVSEATVLADMVARDKRDLTRATVPAKPADDAVMLDTSNMDEEEVFAKVLAIVKSKLGI